LRRWLGMKVLDLFSGIGGFRLGMEAAGHEFVGWVEIDKHARRAYEAIHQPEGEWTAHDITSVTDDDIRLLGRERGPIDVICGGFPCQAFSVAGKRGGFNDTRGTLFFEIARFASILKPKYLFLENVKGLLSHNRGRTFETILRTLDELGYDAEWQVLNSKDFGVPQNRERVFIIGHLRGERTRQVFPIEGEGTETSLRQLNPGTRDAERIYDSRGIARTLKAEGGGLGAKTGLYLVTKKGDRLIPRKIATCLDANYYKGLDSHQARTGVLVRAVLTPDRQKKRQNGRRMKKDGEPMFTLTARDIHGIAFRIPGPNDLSKTVRSSGRGSMDMKHTWDYVHDANYRIRKLTPRECWRLQGFPDWAFDRARDSGISDTQLYKQAGNSVTVNVIYEIAKRMGVE
jgi:DNA (cytosine-5)-methyltransferase 1